MVEPVMTVGELEGFLASEFPQFFHAASGLTIEQVWLNGCRVRQSYREASIRPGGTISGPTMMALADFSMYVAVLASIGTNAPVWQWACDPAILGAALLYGPARPAPG